jgi:ABC-type uncharacterized transport system permease subunit
MFAKNESAVDRVIRTVLGAGLIAVSFTSLSLTSGKPLGIVAAVIGGVLLFTAATGSCLLYKPFHIRTNK